MERPEGNERARIWVAAAVGVIMAAAVFAIGGAHPATQVALSAAVLALMLVQLNLRGRRGLPAVPFAGIAFVGLALTAAQLLPLPHAVVAWLSPAADELHRETSTATFIPLTVDAPATWLALARGLACTALLVVVASLVRSSRHARRLLWLPAGVSALLGVVAIAQRVLGLQAILGFYVPRSMPGFGFFGTFVDVNHAAALLTLGVLVAIGLAVEFTGRRRTLAIATAVASGGALLFTESRGGLLAFGIAGYLLTVLLVSRTHGVARGFVAASVIALTVVASLLWLNEGLRARLGGSSAQLWDNQKTRGWLEGLRMAIDYRWTGVGRGAFAAPINAYRQVDDAVRLVYPENIIVQIASEWGFPAMLALLVLVVVASVRLARRVIRFSPALLAATCGVLAVGLHDLFDFALELPGVAFATVVTLAIVVGAARLDDERARRSVRVSTRQALPFAAAWVFALVGAAWASSRTLDADWDRLHAADERGAVDTAALDAAIARHPADDFLELLAARDAVRRHDGDAMHHVNRALRLHPANWQAHRTAARLLVGAHRTTQAALEYRLAIANGLLMGVPELSDVLGNHIVDAVPQDPKALDALARQLYELAKPVQADGAAQRAVDTASVREPALRERVKLAVQFGNRAALIAASQALLRDATEAESFGVAAEGFAAGGARDAAEEALRAAAVAHVSDGALLLVSARVRLQLGNAAGAREAIVRGDKALLSLSQRKQAEELLAEAADREGDVDAAALARLRASLIARQLHDMSGSSTNGGETEPRR